MLPAQRQALILEQIRRRGEVRVADLTATFGVSPMTIRRDLELLVDSGEVAKVHGGAIAHAGGSITEPAFRVKMGLQRQAKAAIAKDAAQLVTPGSAIGVSAGSTTHAFVRELSGIPALTVVTNSPPVADALYNAPGEARTVILTGGIPTISDALVGPVAVQAIRTLHLDCVFLGVHGMSETAGFTSPNLMEAETNRAMVATAGQLIVLADHTKWGMVGLSEVAALTDADVLISDDGLTPQAREILADSVGELRIVGTGAANDAPDNGSGADFER